jgi:hypothetical protein
MQNNYDSNKLIKGAMTSQVGNTYQKSPNHDKNKKMLKEFTRTDFLTYFIIPLDSMLMIAPRGITAGILAKFHAIFTGI